MTVPLARNVTLKVKLTEQHIQEGIRANKTRCPMALALKAATGYTCVVREGRASSFALGVIELPEVARRWMDDYDAGDKPMLPLTFEITVPERAE